MPAAAVAAWADGGAGAREAALAARERVPGLTLCMRFMASEADSSVAAIAVLQGSEMAETAEDMMAMNKTCLSGSAGVACVRRALPVLACYMMMTHLRA